jgi:molybdopterin-guanine dinucleotide biosynthesis protein A
MAGVILAGGKSSRFGSDKASALLLGKPLLQWVADALDQVCERLVVVTASGQVLPPIESGVPVAVVEDRYVAKGPLAGLVTAFAALDTPLCFATSCDAPLLERGVVELLRDRAEGHDIACPLVNGFLQPLVAVYRPGSCLPVFQEFVERDVLKITAAYGPLRSAIVAEEALREADPELRSFLNANRPDRLAEIAQLLGRSS